MKQKKPAARLKDVAAQAEVSPTTASMVFSETGRISSDTRKKVLAAAGQLGYIHKMRVSRHKTGSSCIGLLLSYDREWSFVWHFLSRMIERIDTDLQAHGLQLLVITISHHESSNAMYQKIRQAGCEAVFSVHIGMEELFQRLEKDHIPTIVIMNNNYQDKFFSICIDDFQGAYEGTRHLISLGHRSLYFIDSVRTDLPNLSTDRYYGFLKAIDEADISHDENLRISFDKTDSIRENFVEILRPIFAGSKRPTALFCLDDEVAINVLAACSELGITVPGELSIIAPGDVLDYSKSYIPPISTMHIDMDYVGRIAVEMLNNRLNNNVNNVHVLKVKQQLIDRGSCRPLYEGGSAPHKVKS